MSEQPRELAAANPTILQAHFPADHPDAPNRLTLPNAVKPAEPIEPIQPIEPNKPTDPTRPLTKLEQETARAASRRWLEPIRSSINPLVGAAQPLFSRLYRLKRDGVVADKATVDKLSIELRKKIVDFARKALDEGYEEELVRAARYAMCTVMDDAVVTAIRGYQGLWTTRSLLSHFHNETIGGERYFTLIKHYNANPARYLHMLELLYVGISTGFTGLYGNLDHGTGGALLDGVRGDLYQSILQLRGNAEPEFSPAWRGQHPTAPRTVWALPWWLVVLFTGTALAIIYGSFAWSLHQEAQRTLRAFELNDPAQAGILPMTELNP